MKDVLQIRITKEKKEAYKKAVGDMSKDLHKHINNEIKKAGK
jgi:hypothetical protein